MKEICQDDVFRISLRIAGLKCLTLWDRSAMERIIQVEALELFHWTMDGHSRDISFWLLTHTYGLRTLAFSPPRQEDNENLLYRPGDLQVVQQHVSGTHLTLFPLGCISSLVRSGTTW